ncbi:MAG: DUF3185 family protein [Opitutales bacterium]|nr:DUF3185 family protein [Opitutales bacterium]
MNTNQILFAAILIGGVILVILGISAMNSFASDMSTFFTGTPTDKSVWMFIAGVVLTVIGLGGVGIRR